MKKSFPDVVIGVVLLVFLTSLAVQVPAIPAVSKGYPMFLLAISYLMSIVLIIKGLRKMKNEEKQETEVVKQVKIIGPYCVMIAIYLFLMDKIGYIASTIIFMIVSLLYLRFKNKLVMILIAVITTALIYIMFSEFIGVILPKARWF